MKIVGYMSAALLAATVGVVLGAMTEIPWGDRPEHKTWPAWARVSNQ